MAADKIEFGHSGIAGFDIFVFAGIALLSLIFVGVIYAVYYFLREYGRRTKSMEICVGCKCEHIASSPKD